VKLVTGEGFALEPGESTKLLISYQTNFFADVAHRDLDFALATGIFPLPMKASFSYNILSNCRRSISRMQMKISLLGFLVASFYILFHISSTNSALGFLDFSGKPLC